jgi:hypothetical protein
MLDHISVPIKEYRFNSGDDAGQEKLITEYEKDLHFPISKINGVLTEKIIHLEKNINLACIKTIQIARVQNLDKEIWKYTPN